MKITLQRLEEIKRNGYLLDLGNAINEIFENYKKIALLCGAVILLVAVVAIVVFGGFAAMFVGVAALTETFTNFSEGTAMSSTFLILNLVGSVIIAGLFAPISAGFIQMAHNAAHNDDFDFGTAFSHYKSQHFKDLFLAAAFIALVGSGFSTFIQILTLNNPDGFLIIGTGIGWLISVLVPIFMLASVPLIIFGKLSALEAIKGSFTIVSKNFWTILLLSIVFSIFAMLGLVAICIGIVFTIPIYYSMQYVIYKTAMPIEETNELDEIGQRF